MRRVARAEQLLGVRIAAFADNGADGDGHTNGGRSVEITPKTENLSDGEAVTLNSIRRHLLHANDTLY